MLNERSKLILKLLCEKNSVSLDDIIQLFGVSQRTIRNDLDNIDSFLQQHSFETVQKSTVVNYSIYDNQGGCKLIPETTFKRAYNE
ncbi:DeoR family transcriptional regulator [Paucilactobacillus sp. N302-9]